MQTLYDEIPGSGITTYVGSYGDDAGCLLGKQTKNQSGSTCGTVTITPSDSTSTTYNPLQGQRWNWQLYAGLTRYAPNGTGQNGGDLAVNWTFTTGSVNDPWVYTDQYGNQVVANGQTTPTGWLTDGYNPNDPSCKTSSPAPDCTYDSNAFQESVTGWSDLSPYDWNDTTISDGYADCGGYIGSGCHYGYAENDNSVWNCAYGGCGGSEWTYVYPFNANLTLSMSVRADNPIPVSFSGTATASITINSNAGVEFGDQSPTPAGL